MKKETKVIITTLLIISLIMSIIAGYVYREDIKKAWDNVMGKEEVNNSQTVPEVKEEKVEVVRPTRVVPNTCTPTVKLVPTEKVEESVPTEEVKEVTPEISKEVVQETTPEITQEVVPEITQEIVPSPSPTEEVKENTPVPTATPTNTNTPVPTATNTPTNTPTNTVTPTNTSTPTPTNTNTPTNTPTNTVTPTNTNTPTPTNTNTPIPTTTNTPVPIFTPKPAYNDPSWQQQVKVTNTPSPTPIKTSDKTDYVKDVDYYMYSYSTYYSSAWNIETCTVYKDTDYSATLGSIKGNNIKIHVVGEYYDKNGSLKLYKVEYNKTTGYMNVTNLIKAKATPTPTPTSIMDSIVKPSATPTPASRKIAYDFPVTKAFFKRHGNLDFNVYDDGTMELSGRMNEDGNDYDDALEEVISKKDLLSTVTTLYVSREWNGDLSVLISVLPNIREIFVDGTNFKNDDITLGSKMFDMLNPFYCNNPIGTLIHFYTLEGEYVTVRTTAKEYTLCKDKWNITYNGKTYISSAELRNTFGWNNDELLKHINSGEIIYINTTYGVNKAELIDISSDCGFEVIE